MTFPATTSHSLAVAIAGALETRFAADFAEVDGILHAVGVIPAGRPDEPDMWTCTQILSESTQPFSVTSSGPSTAVLRFLVATQWRRDETDDDGAAQALAASVRQAVHDLAYAQALGTPIEGVGQQVRIVQEDIEYSDALTGTSIRISGATIIYTIEIVRPWGGR